MLSLFGRESVALSRAVDHTDVNKTRVEVIIRVKKNLMMTLAQEGDSDDHLCIGGQKPHCSILYSSGRHNN